MKIPASSTPAYKIKIILSKPWGGRFIVLFYGLCLLYPGSNLNIVRSNFPFLEFSLQINSLNFHGNILFCTIQYIQTDSLLLFD